MLDRFMLFSTLQSSEAATPNGCGSDRLVRERHLPFRRARPATNPVAGSNATAPAANVIAAPAHAATGFHSSARALIPSALPGPVCQLPKWRPFNSTLVVASALAADGPTATR